MRIKPDELLKSAQAEVKPEPYICLEEYGESIHILYTEKDKTYSEIRNWLRSFGIDYSVASISRSHRTHKHKNGIDY